MSEDPEYHKWRFLIALAFVDNRLMREEREFLQEKITKHAPEGFHRLLLHEMESDVFNPQAPDLYYYRIGSPEDKVDLLSLAHSLFWSDEHLHEREKFYLDGILFEIKKDKEALTILKEKLATWGKDDGEKCLRSYVEEQLRSSPANKGAIV